MNYNNYIDNQVIAQVVVYSNYDNYSTNNILVNDNGIKISQETIEEGLKSNFGMFQSIFV